MGRGQRRRNPAKERFWRRTVKQWRQSGLSIRDFCDWQLLAEATFYFWRRELAKRDREALPGCDRAANGRATRAAQFLPVQIVPEDTPDSGALDCLEVYLPTGVRVRVPSGFDRQTVADVFAALETRPC